MLNHNYFKMNLPLYFVTSNPHKLREFRKILEIPIEHLELELDEIQTTNMESLLKHQLRQAYKEIQKPLLVEDTALFFNAWNKLPGPFIKWFLREQGVDNLVKALSVFEDKTAKAVCVIGYTNGETEHLFEGALKGSIVAPRGSQGFGWDSIFQPEKYRITLGEMQPEKKNKISMRHLALEQFREFWKDNPEL